MYRWAVLSLFLCLSGRQNDVSYTNTHTQTSAVIIQSKSASYGGRFAARTWTLTVWSLPLGRDKLITAVDWNEPISVRLSVSFTRHRVRRPSGRRHDDDDEASCRVRHIPRDRGQTGGQVRGRRSRPSGRVAAEDRGADTRLTRRVSAAHAQVRQSVRRGRGRRRRVVRRSRRRTLVVTRKDAAGTGSVGSAAPERDRMLLPLLLLRRRKSWTASGIRRRGRNWRTCCAYDDVERGPSSSLRLLRVSRDRVRQRRRLRPGGGDEERVKNGTTRGGAEESRWGFFISSAAVARFVPYVNHPLRRTITWRVRGVLRVRD